MQFNFEEFPRANKQIETSDSLGHQFWKSTLELKSNSVTPPVHHFVPLQKRVQVIQLVSNSV